MASGNLTFGVKVGFLSCTLFALYSLRKLFRKRSLPFAKKEHINNESLKTKRRSFYVRFKIRNPLWRAFHFLLSNLPNKIFDLVLFETEGILLQHKLQERIAKLGYEVEVDNIRTLSSDTLSATVSLTSFYDDLALQYEIYKYLSLQEVSSPRQILREHISNVSEIVELKHLCKRHIIPKEKLNKAFEGVRISYHEQKLKEYSRYKDWRQSCYMEVHKIWTPQVPITKDLYECMKEILQISKEEFARWYSARHGLAEVQIETLNSFITKYVPIEGKNEFGKHIDGAKIDGSLILALPTDDPHDWPGLLVWDGPKEGLKNKRPVHHVMLHPGDACFLDAMIWHHGLPITKGARYVMVCFYKCKWKKINLPNSG